MQVPDGRGRPAKLQPALQQRGREHSDSFDIQLFEFVLRQLVKLGLVFLDDVLLVRPRYPRSRRYSACSTRRDVVFGQARHPVLPQSTLQHPRTHWHYQSHTYRCTEVVADLLNAFSLRPATVFIGLYLLD